MPTVLRHRGFEVAIRTGDHGPPHVHVLYGREEVVIILGMGINDPHIREIRGMSRPNIRQAMDIVSENNETLLTEWRRIYP